MSIFLRDGTEVRNVGSLVRHMVLLENNIYKKYDSAETGPDDILTIGEAALANKIGARRSMTVLEGFCERGTRISDALTKLHGYDMYSEYEHIPWAAIDDLMRACTRPPVPGVRLATATKHSTRSGLTSSRFWTPMS